MDIVILIKIKIKSYSVDSDHLHCDSTQLCALRPEVHCCWWSYFGSVWCCFSFCLIFVAWRSLNLLLWVPFVFSFTNSMCNSTFSILFWAWEFCFIWSKNSAQWSSWLARDSFRLLRTRSHMIDTVFLHHSIVFLVSFFPLFVLISFYGPDFVYVHTCSNFLIWTLFLTFEQFKIQASKAITLGLKSQRFKKNLICFWPQSYKGPKKV